MQPFRVQITLRTPMVEPRQAFHLDALLSALRVQVAEKGSEFVDPRSIHHDLPLDRYTSSSGEWCFKASAFRLNRESEAFPWMMTSRSDLVMAAEDRKSGFLKLRAAAPNTAGGPFKSSKFTVDLVWASLEAWGVGDVAGVRELMAHCTHVGGRRGTSCGEVDWIEIQPVSPEECPWYRRALPEDSESFPNAGAMALSIGHLRAPYWDRREHRKILVPVGGDR